MITMSTRTNNNNIYISTSAQVDSNDKSVFALQKCHLYDTFEMKKLPSFATNEN